MLADTPRTWPNGPSLSTLHVILIFAGIPLLVILAVSLLVLAPGWVRGPRYRPGMPWQARSEWFGPPLPSDASEGREPKAAVEGAEPPPRSTGAPPGPGAGTSGSGGASAGW